MRTTLFATAFGTLLLGGYAQLDKPPLEQSLDYLMDGLSTTLPSTPYGQTAFPAGDLPDACRTETENNGLNPDDVTAYNVTYDDCSAPWYLCLHSGSPVSIDDFLGLFGQVPVRTRQWVRHMVLLPADADSAYNSGGNIVVFQNAANINVFIHESGHSLDLLGAYMDPDVSSSQQWTDAYNADAAVPDPYAQTNLVEDVAQNTVVATFDTNVDGGFPSVEPNYAEIQNQYGLLRSLSDGADTGPLITTGGSCDYRLENDPVNPATTSKRTARKHHHHHDVSLPKGIKIIKPKKFSTQGKCNFH